MTPPARVLGARDRAVMHLCWSLGYASQATVAGLLGVRDSHSLTRRLGQLVAAGYLSGQRFGPGGKQLLYGIGPLGRPPGGAVPWRPGLSQVQHTLEVGAALVALTRPGFAAPVRVTGWKGEAELRAWAEPGAPFPDAQVDWTCLAEPGSWLVELDRATESRAAWRRKLARYVRSDLCDGLVLVLTTTPVRAGQIAALGAEMGMGMVSGVFDEACAELDPLVLDTRTRSRVPLSVAVQACGGRVSAVGR